MKIGLVLPSVDGYSETFFSNKIKGLKNQGHEVILFVNSSIKNNETKLKTKAAPNLSGNSIYLIITSLYILIRSLLFHFRVTKKLFKLDSKDGVKFSQRIKNIISNSHILSESLDWLHFGFGTLAINRENVAKAIGAKMAVSFRGFDIAIYPIKNPNCYQKLWNKVDKIHVISNDIADLVKKNGFNGDAQIIKITPAIDTTYFKNDIKNLLESDNNFITIARLHWKKGLEYTLQALALLKKEGISFHYTIVGEGDEYERLKFTAYQLGIKDCVTFTGKITHQSVKDKLKQANIYLQYSIQEGFCNAVIEAQAMGLLCVVSDAEGLSENVNHNKTGWVVPKRKPRDLASKLIEIINLSKLEKTHISKQARIRVQKEFNLQHQNESFKLFYKI